MSVSHEGKVKQHHHVPAPWVEVDTSCVVMSDTAHFVCYTPHSASLQLLAINNGQVFMPTVLSDVGVDTSDASHIEAVVPELGSTLMFRSKPDCVVLMSCTSSQTFTVYKKMDKTFAARVVVHAEKPIVLTLTRSDSETLQLSGTDLNSQTDISDITLTVPFAHYHGSPLKMYPFLFSKKKDGNKPGVKVIFAAQDFSVHFAQKNKASWRREEALASILAVQMVDLPVSESQAKFEDEFGAQEDNLPAMIIKRFKTQFSQVSMVNAYFPKSYDNDEIGFGSLFWVNLTS